MSTCCNKSCKQTANSCLWQLINNKLVTTSSVNVYLHLLIMVPTRFQAISRHEWISRCVSRKRCSKQWTVTLDKSSAVQTIKTGRNPALKWNRNCQEIAGKCLLADMSTDCSTVGVNLERRSDCALDKFNDCWQTLSILNGKLASSQLEVCHTFRAKYIAADL